MRRGAGLFSSRHSRGRGLGRRWRQRLPGEFEPRATSRTKEAVVADFRGALGQNVLKKAVNELGCGKLDVANLLSRDNGNEQCRSCRAIPDGCWQWRCGKRSGQDSRAPCRLVQHVGNERPSEPSRRRRERIEGAPPFSSRRRTWRGRSPIERGRERESVDVEDRPRIGHRQRVLRR